MLAIFKREMQSYFLTPIGYVFIGVFLFLGGIMFYVMNLVTRDSNLFAFLGELSYVWMLLSPVLTMRLLAEEKQKKTDQLLLTSPVSLFGIVGGKYLAALAVLIGTTLLLNVYVLVIMIYGKVYFSEWLVGMLGFILQGAAFLALDLYISGIAQNQVTASVAAFGANLFIWILDLLTGFLTLPAATAFLTFTSLFKRYEPFLMGQLSYASVLFFLCFTLFFLMAAVHHMDARRVKGGV